MLAVGSYCYTRQCGVVNVIIILATILALMMHDMRSEPLNPES